MRRLALLLLLAAPAGLSAQDFSGPTHTIVSPEAKPRADANAALEAGDYTRALALLTPLAAANPRDAHLLYDLAAAQDALSQDKPDQTAAASESYGRAITADPAFFDPRLALGLLQARNGHLPEARATLAAAVALPSGEPLLRARAYRALARLDEKTRPADARDELLEALKLSPETTEDTLLAAELTAGASNGGPAAEAALRRLNAAHPNDPAAAAALAEVLMEQHHPDQAEPILRAALAANPDDPALTAKFAVVLNGNGKAAEALPLLKPVYAAHPDNIDLAHLMAELESGNGDYAAAEAVYESLLTRQPGNVSFLVSSADALIHLKRYGEAQTLLTRAVATPDRFRSPADFGAAAGALAFAASENNDPNASLQALTLRATVLPSTPSMLFLAAIAQDKLHHIRQAQQAYKDFLAASNGALPDQEFEARHRLVALEHLH